MMNFQKCNKVTGNTKFVISGYIRRVQSLLPHNNVYFNIPSFVNQYTSLYYTEERTLIIDVFHKESLNNINKPIRCNNIHIQNGNNINDLAQIMANVYDTKSKFVVFYSHKNSKIDKKYNRKLLIDKISYCNNNISCYILNDWSNELLPNESIKICKLSHCTLLQRIKKQQQNDDTQFITKDWDFSVGNKFQVRDSCGTWCVAEIKQYLLERIYVHYVRHDEIWDEWIVINENTKCDCSEKCYIPYHRIRRVVFETVQYRFGLPFIISILNTTTNRKLYQIIYERLSMWIGHEIFKECGNYDTAVLFKCVHLPFKLKHDRQEIPINDQIFDYDHYGEDIVIEWTQNAYNKINDIISGKVSIYNIKSIQQCIMHQKHRKESIKHLILNWGLNVGNKIDVKYEKEKWCVAEITHHCLSKHRMETELFLIHCISSHKKWNGYIPINIGYFGTLCECDTECKNEKHKIAKINTQSDRKEHTATNTATTPSMIPSITAYDKNDNNNNNQSNDDEKRPQCTQERKDDLKLMNDNPTKKSIQHNNIYPIEVKGYLLKQSLYLKTFRKRWIVLNIKENILYSFKNKESNKMKIYDLKIYDKIQIKISSKKFLFQISSSKQQNNGKKSTLFAAQSGDERDKWIKYISITQQKSL